MHHIPTIILFVSLGSIEEANKVARYDPIKQQYGQCLVQKTFFSIGYQPTGKWITVGDLVMWMRTKYNADNHKSWFFYCFQELWRNGFSSLNFFLISKDEYALLFQSNIEMVRKTILGVLTSKTKKDIIFPLWCWRWKWQQRGGILSANGRHWNYAGKSWTTKKIIIKKKYMKLKLKEKLQGKKKKKLEQKRTICCRFFSFLWVKVLNKRDGHVWKVKTYKYDKWICSSDIKAHYSKR